MASKAEASVANRSILSATRPSPWFISYDAGRVADSIDRFATDASAFEAIGMGHGTPFETGGSDRLAALADP